ncbi:MAG: D-alanine--D-alanine ligase [Lachnospiraceae bacterium]|nr:D-alanine--D-alanine ligase [Lachnospiraceae bacterium]
MRKTVAVLFGGQSSEHDVSCVSVQTVVANIDKSKYEVILVGITKDGKWLLADSLDAIASGQWVDGKTKVVFSPDATDQSIWLIRGENAQNIHIDVVFPVLHGLYGEDGTVQGIMELARIPYVGCGVLSSAVTMDKLYTKMLVDAIGIRQAAYVPVRKSELSDMSATIARIEEKLAYPVFVKPCNAGSSQGVSKADNREALVTALNLAAEHDRKILVEETIVGRELECAVLGGEDCKASGIGEVVAAAEFYDYEAKYHNAESKTVISPELPEGKEEEIRTAALKIFKQLDCYGLSRVDFFLTNDTNEVVFNEINTIPGFTAISMYPMLWEAKGISKEQLVEKLLQSAMARYND